MNKRVIFCSNGGFLRHLKPLDTDKIEKGATTGRFLTLTSF